VSKSGEELPVLDFQSAPDLRAWLTENCESSKGIWVRIYKIGSHNPSVSFEEVLDEGLCFGWSESMRRKGDEQSYLQRFAPRQTKGTTSRRNLEHAKRLIRENRMTEAGLRMLGMDENQLDHP
jgi:uncharacterized protein YdeI (YjbR/CyaY-like superfamily)